MSTSKLRLRPYQPSDLYSLYELDRVCFADPFRFSRSAMKRFAEAKNARVVVAELDGDVVAFCIAHVHRLRGERVAYVNTIDVAPAHRRKGVAHELMLAIEAKAIEAVCGAVILHVFAENESAIRFYERESFVLLGVQEDFYAEGLHALIYRKELLPPE